MRRLNVGVDLDVVLLAVAVAAVSTSAPLVRAAHAPALAIAFWRTALAVPVMGSLALRRDRAELAARDPLTRRRMVVAGLLLAGHFATWIPSLSFTSVASSVTLVCAQPVWVALIARRRGEHVPPAVWRGIACALAGVVLLSGVDLALTPRALLGDGLALAGGMLSALYLVVGADVRRVTTTAVYATWCYGVAAVALLGICVVGRQSLGGYPEATWLVLLALTVGPQLLGHTLVNRVVRTLSPTLVSVAILLEIVGSTLLAWLFFDEVPPVSVWPAAALIAAGVVVVVRAEPMPPALPD
ncbi:MAG TPA: DMT family transporter [Acidimicrobiales bacterium]|nr:DMT family transporter [Acidimicrobiales bacterium]